MKATLIRYAAHSAVMALVLACLGAVLCGLIPAWPGLAFIAASGITTVALLERLQPYEPAWQCDHHDFHADVLHGANFGLLTGEHWGQALRLRAAITLTWLRMPKGNTGGARAHPLHVMPIPTALRSYMETSR